MARGDDRRAVVYLAGHPVTGNSGYETSLGGLFTGLYEAERDGAGWRLGRNLPIDAGNRILAQTIDVELRPGIGLVVDDTPEVTVANRDGFRVMLNRVARLDAIGRARLRLAYTTPSTRLATRRRTATPLAATPVDGVWRVEVPLSEGRYPFDWRVDEEYVRPEGSAVRIVRPATRLEAPYPR